ncbi:MAG: hypothetical protein AB7F86_11295 [Bdellovibrionales bacterium]
MFKMRYVLVLTLASGLAACAKMKSHKGSSPMAPLSDEQRTKVTRVSESMTVATQAAQSAGQKKAVQPAAAIAPEKPKEEKIRDMSKALSDSGLCKFESNLPTNGGANPQTGQFSMSMSGEGCPIQLAMGFDYNVTHSNQSGEVKFTFFQKYAVVDAMGEYQRLNDVTGVDVGGSFNVHVDRSGASGGGVIAGSIKSQAYGDIMTSTQMSVSANQSSATSTITTYMNFPDFSAKGQVVMTQSQSGEPTVAYSINDQPSSEKEFQQVFGPGLGGLGGAGTGNTGPVLGFPTR